MMKKVLALLLFIVASFAFTKSSSHPILLQEGPGKMWCAACGMNLQKFYKTNHAVILKNGKKKQYCSLHCLVEDWPNIKNSVKEILVVDAKSGKFIPAKSAYYVVGSRIPGTMSKQSKIAFAKKVDAQNFAKQYGGKIVTFDEAFALAQKEHQKENKMIQAKKRVMIYPMGEMLYKKRCKKEIDKERFPTIGELKSYLVSSKVCGDLKGKKLQAVALYIWEVKGKKHIHVPKSAKCPVCGMFVAKHPRWATMAVTKDGKKLYFDGVKDMMKYYFAHPDLKRLYVSDYYTLEAVDAKKAYYVLGSDVMGPMGKELVPFKNRSEAEDFAKDHKGEKVLAFEEITKEVINELE